MKVVASPPLMASLRRRRGSDRSSQIASKDRDGARALIADQVEEMLRFDNGG